ncbi:Gfo/Idh/MocA family protein [Planomicrobium okeanokoites]|uniref:Gfo/Idh/MocA family protein n=1 Tax=Planomicrobium okeanokoites TaxID=244 RepID=UPI001C4DDC11|nr:Gfo/Idh/MocA family oxidoreductase [Planomicrobium okeanokoites]
MGKDINFAIVGCGTIATQHINAILKTKGAKLGAVYSRRIEKAEKWAHKYGVQAFGDYEALLQSDGIDAVVILTPSGTHADFGIKAAEAGKHVVVEKPIDINLEKAKTLVRACEKAGVKLSCIFQHRFDEAIIRLKEAVDAGELGQLNFGSSRTTWYRPQAYYDSGEWRGTRELDGGGALMNQSIHYIDLLLYIMGPVEEVYGYCATRGHERIDVEDIAVANVKFASGALGIIEGNTTAFPGFNTELDIFGESGSVRISSDEIAEWHIKNEEAATITAGATKTNTGKNTQTVDYGLSFSRQYEDIVQAFQKGTAPLVNGKEAIRTLEVILAIYESAESGKVIKLRNTAL